MNAIKKMTLLILALCVSVVSYAQIPEKPEFGKFAITNADIYTVTNGVIENGVVLIDGETIEYVGQNAKITNEYTRIDASGKRVYPGLIDAGTGLGLMEISAVAVTNDQNEVGTFNPNIRAFTAINPHSVAIPVTRTNGITTVISNPGSGIISGKSTLINLYGNSPDSMAVLKEATLVHSFPSSTGGGWWDDRSPEEVRKDFEENLQAIQDYWDEAIAYHNMMTAYENDPSGKTKPTKDRRLDALREVINGDIPVALDVSDAKDIINALEWIKEMQEEGLRFILTDVDEGWLVADEIAEAGVPCIVGPVLSTPGHSYFNYQSAYQNAAKLHEAGVQVAIQSDEVENVRNLPFNAGYAATYGMGTEAALEAVTIVPARIFGVGDKIGSLEEGKIANLFIADGDPFEPLTQIEEVFISGYQIPYTNRHLKLYEQFLDRSGN